MENLISESWRKWVELNKIKIKIGFYFKYKRRERVWGYIEVVSIVERKALAEQQYDKRDSIVVAWSWCKFEVKEIVYNMNV